jgi:hemerythrin-like domain-containing protein
MDEHLELLELGGEVRRALAAGDRSRAWQVLGSLARELDHHVSKEERGVFRALRDQGEYIEAVAELEGEHADFDELLSDLGLDDVDLEARVDRMLADLSEHIDKENLGIFPVAVVTLNASGWDTVSAAHTPVAAL